MTKKSLLLGTSFLVASSLAMPAFAQDDEIIVTATKREQTLQEVPVAVTVTDSETIEKANIQDVIDLQSVVPSLRVAQFQFSASTNFIIRGFGNGANNAGIEPSVGVFVDGVYRSRTGAAISDLPNLERVEVLRGPQSTLFGKNASAGVISIVTGKPNLDEFEASIEGTASNFSGYGGKFYVSGPTGDTVAWSLGGSFNKRGGTADSNIGELNDRNRYALRGQMLWVPTDVTEVRVIGDFDHIADEVCCFAGNLVAGPTVPVTDFLAGGQSVDPENVFGRQGFLNSLPKNDIQNWGVSLHVDHDLGDFAKLTSITAYREGDAFSGIDADFTGADLIATNTNDTQLETFSQEFRLAGGTERFDWLLGAYYFDEEVAQVSALPYGADIRGYADGLAGGPAALAGIEGAYNSILQYQHVAAGNNPATFTPVAFFQEGQGRVSASGQDNTAWSIFGSLDFHVTDRLTLTGGINYTSDEKDTFASEDRNEPFSEVDLRAFGFAQAYLATGGNYAVADAIAQTPCTPSSAPGSCNAALALEALQFMPVFVPYPNAVEDGSSEDTSTTWSLRAAYDVNDMVNVYASASTGFKATSWNLSTDSRPFASDFSADFRPQYEEYVEAFSAGAIPGAAVTPPPGYDPTAGGLPPFVDGTFPLNAAGLAGQVGVRPGTRFAGPEDAFVLELGAKFKFDRGFVNIAVFDQEIEGFQSNAFTGTGFNLVNAGKQSTTGFEIDSTFAATENLTLSFSGTFLDPKYDSFPGASGPGGTIVDLSGEDVEGIAKTNIVVGANYDHEFQNGMTGFVRGDYQYESDTQIANNVPAVASREVGTMNLSAGLTTSDGSADVMIWGRNVTDDEYLISAFPSVAQAGSFSAYPNQPRTYGITVRKRF